MIFMVLVIVVTYPISLVSQVKKKTLSLDTI